MKPFVIVTVQVQNKQFNYDIEVPTDVPAAQLTEDILETLRYFNKNINLPQNICSLYCKRLNRALQKNETFGSAGIWNGDIILIQQ